jgi:hypothetical protein
MYPVNILFLLSFAIIIKFLLLLNLGEPSSSYLTTLVPSSAPTALMLYIEASERFIIGWVQRDRFKLRRKNEII